MGWRHSTLFKISEQRTEEHRPGTCEHPFAPDFACVDHIHREFLILRFPLAQKPERKPTGIDWMIAREWRRGLLLWLWGGSRWVGQPLEPSSLRASPPESPTPAASPLVSVDSRSSDILATISVPDAETELRRVTAPAIAAA